MADSVDHDLARLQELRRMIEANSTDRNALLAISKLTPAQKKRMKAMLPPRMFSPEPPLSRPTPQRSKSATNGQSVAKAQPQRSGSKSAEKRPKTNEKAAAGAAGAAGAGAGEAAVFQRETKKQKINVKGVTSWGVGIAVKFNPDVLAGIPFAEVIWEMMYSFGDGRGVFACWCSFGGEMTTPCPCLMPVKLLEQEAQRFLRDEIVVQARNESCGVVFGTKHLQAIMPSEMAEYMRWRKQRDSSHDKDGRGAASGDGAGGSGSSAAGRSRIEEDDEALLEGLENDEYAAFGDDDIDELSCELLMENAPCADRMIMRRAFADLRSKTMAPGAYNSYTRRRETFFLGSRGAKAKRAVTLFREWSNLVPQTQKSEAFSGKGDVKSKLSSGAAAAAAASEFSGAGSGGGGGGGGGGKQITGRTLQALAFLAYDYVGMIVEEAIAGRHETLRQIKPEKPLDAREIRKAIQLVRSKRVGVGDSGASSLRFGPIAKFRVGLICRGNPLKWPKSAVITDKAEDAGDADLSAIAERLSAVAKAKGKAAGGSGSGKSGGGGGNGGGGILDTISVDDLALKELLEEYC